MVSKRHHYLPQTYLRKFAFDEKSEYTYTYQPATGRVTPMSIRKICTKNKLYEIENERGEKTDEIENAFFAQRIEPIYNPLIEKITSQVELTNSEIADLAIYISLQLLRLPSTFAVLERLYEDAERRNFYDVMAKLRDDEYREEMVARYRMDFPESEIEFNRDDVEDIMDGKRLTFTPNIPHNNIVKAAIELAEPASERLLNMEWRFVSALPKTAYITSDKPVAVIEQVEGGYSRLEFGGFGIPGAMVIFPLTKTTCLLLLQRPHRQMFMSATKSFTKDINQLMADDFDHYVISHSDRLLRKMVGSFQ